VAERTAEPASRWEIAIPLVVQVVGAAAALAAWVVLVGGIRVYLRLEAANVPAPTRTVTLLPRDVLLAEGIRALGFTLLLAVAAGAVAYLAAGWLARRERPASWPAEPLLRAAVPALFAAAAAAIAVADGVSRHRREGVQYWLLLAAIALVLIVLALAALLRWPAPAAVATVAAGLVLTWGGAYELVTERGNADPEFEPVQVIRTDGEGVRGLLIARSDSSMTLLCAGDPRSLLTVQGGEISQTSF
jgi:hypothetical protein